MYPVYFLLILCTFTACKGRSEPTIAAPAVVAEPTLSLISERVIAVPEPSGLAYNAISKTLYTVSDQNSTIYEISLGGDILKSFTVPSIDLEGITFSKNYDTLTIVEESSYQAVTYSLSGTRLSSFKLVTSSNTKHGYEGITLNKSGHYVILNEKDPMLILEADLLGKEISRKEINYTIDISDICYDAALDCYWVVSDESQKVLKLSSTFTLLQSWKVNTTQAEGIAVTDKNIYIVSDADSRFHVYKKP